MTHNSWYFRKLLIFTKSECKGSEVRYLYFFIRQLFTTLSNPVIKNTFYKVYRLSALILYSICTNIVYLWTEVTFAFRVFIFEIQPKLATWIFVVDNNPVSLSVFTKNFHAMIYSIICIWKTNFIFLSFNPFFSLNILHVNLIYVVFPTQFSEEIKIVLYTTHKNMHNEFHYISKLSSLKFSSLDEIIGV